MIHKNSFTKKWIEKVRAENPELNINPPLLEKMIHALSLCEYLKINDLDFIFKGGTCLTLLFDKLHRLSIDIDIVTTADRTQLEHALDEINKKSHFTGVELDEKRSYKQGIPKAHYRLFFEPAVNQDNNILLDILFDKHSYPQIEGISVEKKWIDTRQPLINVNVPTIESITGDKLTAFAPNTTGIPYGQRKHTEIIKQMFDLGHLYDQIKDFDVVIQSFQANVVKEISYRAPSLTADEVLDDILNTCFDIVKESQLELKEGIKTFKNWSTQAFRRNNAIETAGKIAYITAKIKANDTTLPLRFDAATMNKKDYLIQHQDYNFLNKKVKNAKDAMFYWHHVVEVITKHPQLFDSSST